MARVRSSVFFPHASEGVRQREFRLLVVQRTVRGRFSPLIPYWARLPGWQVRSAAGVTSMRLPAAVMRPHAVLVDTDPGTAARVLRDFPEAHQVLHVDERTDPADAAGFDAVVCSSWWQRDRHPEVLRSRIDVIHEGIASAQPDAAGRVLSRDGRPLCRGEPVLSVLMEDWSDPDDAQKLARVLARVLRAQAGYRVLVIGRPLPSVSGCTADLARIDLVDDPGEARRGALLAVSRAHLHPGRTSQSALEAMASACAVVAPGHAPAREVLRDGVSGCLVDAAGADALADAAIGLLDDAARAERYGREARADVARDYDVATAALRYARLLHGPLDDEEILPWPALPCREGGTAYSFRQ
ncbi:MAG: glycosyltransferase [Methyloversatilis sp.]|nr:glycosyltransferase [Methyloversatilis sp.]